MGLTVELLSCILIQLPAHQATISAVLLPSTDGLHTMLSEPPHLFPVRMLEVPDQPQRAAANRPACPSTGSFRVRAMARERQMIMVKHHCPAVKAQPPLPPSPRAARGAQRHGCTGAALVGVRSLRRLCVRVQHRVGTCTPSSPRQRIWRSEVARRQGQRLLVHLPFCNTPGCPIIRRQSAGSGAREAGDANAASWCPRRSSGCRDTDHRWTEPVVRQLSC